MKIYFVLIFIFVWPLCFSLSVRAAAPDDTMLMFVGENQPVVTVASRYPESPVTAPAMVTLVDREQIENFGYATIAELLADQPGFYMAPGGRGTLPYLRGLRDSVLFLYDGVPITTDVTKSFAALDAEISLAAVERVEIVRGAGSVLWGADAFSGVVNIVPRTGKQTEVGSLDVKVGSNQTRGGDLTISHAGKNWDAFLALSDLREKYHQFEFQSTNNADATVTEIPESKYQEMVATLNLGSWLHVSGRWSDFSRHYTMQNAEQTLRWPGNRQAPFSYIKASINQQLGPSHYSLSGFLQQTDYQVRDADTERKQSNRVQHIELLWDRRLLTRGMLTLGASWRKNRVKGAVVRDGFLPEFLAASEGLFIPNIEQEDFSSDLLSAFGQFRYRLERGEWWVGLRNDRHSQYRNTLSYSLGLYRPLGEKIHWKTAYGTAFRSPYSSQLYNNQKFEPESVQTLSTQLAFKFSTVSQLELTLFYSWIKDHRAEDPYGGLSLPDSRQIYGSELAVQHYLARQLRADLGLTLFGGNHGEENYRIRAYSYLRPDGTQVDEYDSWSQSYDQGPQWLMRLGLSWVIAKNHILTVSGHLAADTHVSHAKGTTTQQYDAPLLVNLAYRRPGFFSRHESISVKVTNLFDRNYQVPDVYGPTQGPPLQLTLTWSLKF